MTTTNPSWLPEGYSTVPPPGAMVLGADAHGYREYGGADRSKGTDGANVRHKALCAWKDKAMLRPDETEFGFRVFREDPITRIWSEVVYWGDGQHVFCSGRGEINVQGGWIAGLPDGSDDDGQIPGWVPIATTHQPSASRAYVECVPSRYTPAIDDQAISGGRSLDMTSLFGTPPNARAYAVNLSVTAATADVRARLGTEQEPDTCRAITQAPNVQQTQSGIVNAGPGGRVWLSVAPSGAVAQVWLKIVGYWPGSL